MSGRARDGASIDGQHEFQAVAWGMAAFIALLLLAQCDSQRPRKGLPSDESVLIVLDDHRQLRVKRVDKREVRLERGKQRRGRLDAIWVARNGSLSPRADDGSSGVSTPASDDSAQTLALTRGSGAGGGSEPAVVLTAQLDQILGQTVVRGSAFTTPHNGAILDPQDHDTAKPARGHAKNSRRPWPVLCKGKQEIARIDFKSDQQKLVYDEIPALAEKMPDGLPAGGILSRRWPMPPRRHFSRSRIAEWRNEVMSASRSIRQAHWQSHEPPLLAGHRRAFAESER